MNIITTVEMVMPDKAKEYLATMGKNRPISSREIDKWCRIIRNGDFKTTHQGIAFNEHGELIDGQHRLTACALTGIPITVCVTRGLNDDTMTSIDVGKTRTFHDVLSLMDFEDDPAFRSDMVFGSVRTVIYYGFSHNFKATAKDTAKVVYEYSDLCKALYRAAYTRSASNRPPVTVGGAALSAMICGEKPDVIRAFFDSYLNFDAGDGSHNHQAAFSLAKIIQDSKAKRVALKKSKVYNIAQVAIWHFSRNTSIKRLQERPQLLYDVSGTIKNILKGE